MLLFRQLPSIISRIPRNSPNGYGDSSSIAHLLNSLRKTNSCRSMQWLTAWATREMIFLRALLSGRRGKKYDKVKEKFNSHFISKRNVIFERAKFSMRKQEPNKPTDAFITNLYCLSEHCEFGTPRGKLIHDHFVVGLQKVKLSKNSRWIRVSPFE